ncbi:unnamed protein product [Linum trigynum]|uniref:Uncharacterized protein n=1 Tax=Linum trigynum TaxID=586398 RepID=A0AAV2E3J1_9ROSI
MGFPNPTCINRVVLNHFLSLVWILLREISLPVRLHQQSFCFEITVARVHATYTQQTFTVEQWLTTDTSLYELSAARNFSPYDMSAREKTRDLRSASTGGRAAFALLRQVVDGY